MGQKMLSNMSHSCGLFWLITQNYKSQRKSQRKDRLIALEFPVGSKCKSSERFDSVSFQEGVIELKNVALVDI